MRAQLLEGLRAIRPDLQINGHPDNGLPNTLNVSFPGLTSQEVLAKISDRLAVSAGAACHSGKTAVSPVLSAMGIDEPRAQGALRFSTGRQLTSDQVELALAVLGEALKPE